MGEPCALKGACTGSERGRQKRAAMHLAGGLLYSKTSREKAVWKTLPLMWIKGKNRSGAHHQRFFMERIFKVASTGISKWLFACGNAYLGMSHWWSSKQELLLVQVWVVLILSHLVYGLRERIARASDCDPFEVSVPLLVDLLPRLGNSSSLQLDQLAQSGRKSGLLRASPRLVLHVPHVELSCYQLAPPDLPRHQPGRAPSAPRSRAHKPATRVCGRPGCSGRDVKCPSRPRL
jgi:hypothetical protein